MIWNPVVKLKKKPRMHKKKPASPICRLGLILLEPSDYSTPVDHDQTAPDVPGDVETIDDLRAVQVLERVSGEVIGDFDVRIFLGIVKFDIEKVMETEAEQPGSAEEMINALEIDRNYWREQVEKHDGNLKVICETAIELTEKHLDEIRLRNSLARNR